jgi:hypothetical protein
VAGIPFSDIAFFAILEKGTEGMRIFCKEIHLNQVHVKQEGK